MTVDELKNQIRIVRSMIRDIGNTSPIREHFMPNYGMTYHKSTGEMLVHTMDLKQNVFVIDAFACTRLSSKGCNLYHFDDTIKCYNTENMTSFPLFDIQNMSPDEMFQYDVLYTDFSTKIQVLQYMHKEYKRMTINLDYLGDFIDELKQYYDKHM